MPSSSKVVPFDYVDGRSYNCRNCRLFIASASDKFTSQTLQAENNGRATLFEKVSAINVICGAPQPEIIQGTAYRGSVVYCANCQTSVGFKYLFAPGGPENYRQGKVQLHRTRVIRSLNA